MNTVSFFLPSSRDRRHVLIGCLSLLLAPLAATSASSQTILLSGATVHTVSGETLSPGQVLIKEDKVVAVGKSLSASGAQTIDLTGEHLYPGMIALNTVLGLTEISGV